MEQKSTIELNKKDAFGHTLSIGDRVTFTYGGDDGYGTIVGFDHGSMCLAIRLAHEVHGFHHTVLAGGIVYKTPKRCLKLREDFDIVGEPKYFDWDASIAEHTPAYVGE